MTAGTAWAAVVLVAIVTFTIKAVGPALLGSRDGAAQLPPRLTRVVVLLSAPLLMALVVTNALADGDRLVVGGDTLGIAVAGLLVWRGLSVLPAVVVAAVVTAVGRQLGLA